MSNAADQLANILPVIVVGSVATKMTDSMFSPKKKATRRRKSKKESKR